MWSQWISYQQPQNEPYTSKTLTALTNPRLLDTGDGGVSVPVKCGASRPGQDTPRHLWKEVNLEEEEIPTRHPDNAVPPLEEE